MNAYPMLGFIGRHGGWLAVVLALLPPATSAVPVSMGFSAWWLATGVVTGAIVFVLVRSYVELVRVMTDMLLPK
jgi:hypothetical protein